MNKTNLQDGMEVVLRDGEKGTISKNVTLIELDKGGCYELCYFNDDLTRESKNTDLDIVSVLWKVNDIKEVTMRDIENKFGCRVKIVG